MQRLMIVVVLALPFVTTQAFACGMEVADDEPSALDDLMAMVDDAAEQVVDVVVEAANAVESATAPATQPAAEVAVARDAAPDRADPPKS